MSEKFMQRDDSADDLKTDEDIKVDSDAVFEEMDPQLVIQTPGDTTRCPTLKELLMCDEGRADFEIPKRRSAKHRAIIL